LRGTAAAVSLGEQVRLSVLDHKALVPYLVAIFVGLLLPTPTIARAPGASAAQAQVADTAERPQEPGSELRVWLLTAAPGDAVWERFGHNAIRVLDTTTRRDVAYNWGIFDFDQVDFVPRFLKGQMLYMMAPFQAGPMVESYARADREIVAQELDLAPSQRLAIRDFAERNALPQNREYFYDYFLDNCSTRIRDLLDLALGGTLHDRFGDEPTGTTWRFHTRRLTQMDPFLFTGMDLLLGRPGDESISTWQEMFLPMTLRDAARVMTIVGDDGASRPLVKSEEVLSPSSRGPEAAAPPSWLPVYLALGLLLGGLLALGGHRGAAGSRPFLLMVGTVGTIWSLVAGLVGLILVLVLFTDHHFMVWNENIFLLNPVSLALALLVPLSIARAKYRRAAKGLAMTMVGLGITGLLVQPLPASTHQNELFFALALPVHLGLAYALHRIGHSTAQAGRHPR
jgi:hypothetical protein